MADLYYVDRAGRTGIANGMHVIRAEDLTEEDIALVESAIITGKNMDSWAFKAGRKQGRTNTVIRHTGKLLSEGDSAFYKEQARRFELNILDSDLTDD